MVQAGIRLPEPGAKSIWLNGLAVSKGAYSNRQIDGKVKSRFSKLPASVLLVERAALVEHMLLEMQRLEQDRCVLPSHVFALLHVHVTCSELLIR